MFRRASLLALACSLAGCPGPVAPPDAGSDAAPSPDAGPDAPTVTPTDAGSDAGAALPPIIRPEPHTVPASEAGHDRYLAVAFDSDSSFYVAGVAADGTDAGADFRVIVRHFGADGELDADFGEAGLFERNLVAGTNGEIVRSIAVDSEGRIVVVGTVEAEGAADTRDRDAFALRVLPSGVIDPAFADGGVAILDFSEGVVSGTSFVADAGFGLAIDEADRAIVHGAEVRAGGEDLDWVVARLTEAGELDPTFAGDGTFSLDIGSASANARHIERFGGRILASGYTTLSGGVIQPVVFALTDAGELDPAFGDGGIFTEVVLPAQTEVYDVARVGDALVTCGYGRADGPGDNDFLSLRLDASGALDRTYGEDGVALLTGFDFGDNARELVALPDGRTLHVGALRTSASEADAALVMFGPDGSIDTTFDGDGVQLVNTAPGTVDHFWSVAVDPLGLRVVAVGIGGTDPATDDDGLLYLFDLR